jgi:hypothetical protein
MDRMALLEFVSYGLKGWGWKVALLWGAVLILWCWNWTHPGPRFLGRDTVNSSYGWEWVPDYHSDDNEDTLPPRQR